MMQMKIKTILASTFLGAAFFLTPLQAAETQTKSNETSPATYLCTGVGESKDDPRWKEYPLKLMFTGSGRAYISEVKVELKDDSGLSVIKIDCDGPWLLAKLKPGKYSVQATVEGVTKTAIVTVPAMGQLESVIRFPHIPQGY